MIMMINTSISQYISYIRFHRNYVSLNVKYVACINLLEFSLSMQLLFTILQVKEIIIYKRDRGYEYADVLFNSSVCLI